MSVNVWFLGDVEGCPEYAKMVASHQGTHLLRGPKVVSLTSPKHPVQCSSEFCLNIFISILWVSRGKGIVFVEMFLTSSSVGIWVFCAAGDRILVLIIMKSASLNLRVDILIDPSEGNSLHQENSFCWAIKSKSHYSKQRGEVCIYTYSEERREEYY